jgi:hypothetical protein
MMPGWKISRVFFVVNNMGVIPYEGVILFVLTEIKILFRMQT